MQDNTNQNTDSNTTFSFRQINTEELQLAIGKIDHHKKWGIKNVSSFLFKKCIDILFFQFKHILNNSISTSIFPTKWKHAIITPIWKAKSKTNVKNYRPIVCLPLPGKILEKLVHKQLYNYLELNKLISDNQYGFREKRNTTDAID